MQTILIIDDDEGLAETIAILLQCEGFTAIIASDGRSGFEQALLMAPDLILCDLYLPDIHGFEVCTRLRVAGVRTPIIAISAVVDEIDQALLRAIGADDYVEKPFGTRDLVARICTLLRRAPGPTVNVCQLAEIRTGNLTLAAVNADREGK